MRNEFEAQFQAVVGKNFNEYYKVFNPKLLWHVQNIVQDQDDAKDIVDMAFMKALKKLDCYNPKYAFSTWLFTIANKMAMQYLKDKKRWSSLDQEVFGDGGGVTAGDRLMSEENIQPEDDQRFKLKAEVIMEYIEDLDPRYKRVIVMRELQHMAYQDIADELDMNLSTVKNHIRSGRQILMKRAEKPFQLIDENY